MKRIIFLLTIVVAVISCTKQDLNKSDEYIPTFSVGPSTNSSNVEECGTCGHLVFGYPLQVPDGPYICYRTLTNFCYLENGPIYRGDSGQDGFDAEFKNVNGKLVMVVDKLSFDENLREAYFQGNALNFEKPEYMDERILVNLNLPVPYLIKSGIYQITSENPYEFSIAL